MIYYPQSNTTPYCIFTTVHIPSRCMLLQFILLYSEDVLRRIVKSDACFWY